ncbi:DUF4307 domain-containing protein [Nocardioides sp. GY 10113]|uniref:DUF4307 domain-containing protein n=1 Tax=Nocardioides sp. GY 10113 TaxID=2569761 RepID=UPI0010A9245A|nr:DUF4307 domain-containing protein [Nocardioides sp. GY 10113]TIC83257.1 DUF4307 domain-containing protein [Nocardioides sp. GY 10113]
MSTDQDSLEQRYGAPSRTGRIAVAAVGGAIVAALLGWLVWTADFWADPPVSSKMLTNDVLDDHTATVTARIQYGDGPVEATCTIRAIAHDKTIVGEVTVSPDPADGPDHTWEISTDRRATAVDWLGCTAEGQPRPH